MKIKHANPSSGDESDSNENTKTDKNSEPHETAAGRIPNGEVHVDVVKSKLSVHQIRTMNFVQVIKSNSANIVQRLLSNSVCSSCGESTTL